MPRRVSDLPERLQELIRRTLPPEIWEQAQLWELGEPSRMVFVHELDERWTRFGRPSH